MRKDMATVNKFIQNNRVAIIAEMAQSYEGSADVAIETATNVCRAGVDAVMFQIVYADELAIPENDNYELFRSLELSADNWRQIITKVHQVGSMAFGEIFGDYSVEVALEAGIDGFKIHAADVSNLALLRRVGGTDLPILLSVGGSLEEEIRMAIKILQDSGNCEIILMHGYQLCPTSLEDSHLMKIQVLKDVFDLPVGYGDHVAGCVDGDVSRMNPLSPIAPLLVIGAGAKVIEKHVILDRTRAWEDYESALTPDEFVDFVTSIRNFEKMLGDKSLTLNTAEKKYRVNHKKYIVAACDIPGGTMLNEWLITFKRIEKPDEGIVSAEEVVGKVLCHSIGYNDVIKRDNISGTRKTKAPVDAILACRVQGARLYGKPLQTLVPGGITIIESLIEYLKAIKSVRKIVFAISEGQENYGFIRLANRLGLPYVIGDERDVLQRILDAAYQEGTEYVFRITTEGPFVIYEYADDLIQEFVEGGYDWGSYIDSPEGTGFELVTTRALQFSHDQGTARNRSELVTSYIAENPSQFKMLLKKLPDHMRRIDVRLTVDYAEDLVFCQTVYKELKREGELIPVEKIIEFWNKNPKIRKPVEDIGVDWGTGRLVWTESDKEKAKVNSSHHLKKEE